MKKDCPCKILGPLIFLFLIEWLLCRNNLIFNLHYAIPEIILGTMMYFNISKDKTLSKINKNITFTDSNLFLVLFLGIIIRTIATVIVTKI